MTIHPAAELFEGQRDRREDILARILGNVTETPGPMATPCWIWNGTHSGANGRGRGYPRMKIGGQTVAVHRVIATHFYGYIPGNKQVDHRCRNRMCVNPGHLEIVTHLQNQKRRDRARAAIGHNGGPALCEETGS